MSASNKHNMNNMWITSLEQITGGDVAEFCSMREWYPGMWRRVVVCKDTTGWKGREYESTKR
jgi:hypothetical protein